MSRLLNIALAVATIVWIPSLVALIGISILQLAGFQICLK